MDVFRSCHWGFFTKYMKQPQRSQPALHVAPLDVLLQPLYMLAIIPAKPSALVSKVMDFFVLEETHGLTA